MISWDLIKKHKLGIPLLWDITMVFVVLGNLALIVFDLSYLSLRPFYFHKFPEILELYDKPILGIEAHRTTTAYTDLVDDLKYLTQLRDDSFRENQRKITREDIYKILTSLKSQVSNEKFDSLYANFESALQIEDVQLRRKKVEETLVQLNDFFSVLEETDEITTLSELSEKYAFINRLSVESNESKEITSILQRMDKRMLEIVESNPFAMSGQTHFLSEIQTSIKTEYQTHKTKARDIKLRQELDPVLNRDRIPSTVVAFAWFWRDQNRSLEQKIDFFNSHFKEYFALNYYRAISSDGSPVNHYLLLDAPFLFFFLAEFIISWLIAIRNKTYIAWFLYPIYHWYDVLGLIPLVEFRFFRLVRVYKIYLMLQTNQFTRILGNDLISKTLRYYSNIIKEEISDIVTIQILTETQNEVKSGNSLDQLVNAIDQNRDELKKVAIKNIAKSAQNPNLQALIQNLVTEVSERVSANMKPISLLPKEMQANLTKQISLTIYSAISQATVAMATDPSGKKSIENLIDYLIDEMILIAQDPDMVKLNTNITVALIENMKKSIGEKKWLKAEIGSS
ncbi:hypothetical protein [Leptospira terpstrae]|uniref:Uncharacterized protein n=1 Tax=Leptospira terpstrae serovar Hualin str. LT 11-33 = ATCC 700639 TaxID=1257025 RepID=N1VW59_9LEPT|nr:hypothetical protein [Leptospira terpstrae]EMY62758.1 hypothetical protein LEP1GSC203_3560 [Leptospira terpstrae serovar Hualin str. LT 11-33 = ATCC 700639]